MPTHQGCSTMETDVVIAVMGLTGVGKSSFIKNVTGREDIQIGHGLTSETSEVRAYSFTHQGTQYTLVDTPGFNDTFESDEAITENILKWLDSSYRAGARLNGILYLHSIAAPKMAGSAFDNLCMFRKLCGEDALGHVVLATTFWGTIDPVTEERRESVLTQDRTLWGRMISAGSKAVRLENTRTSALKALRDVSSTSKVMLQAQHEMIDEGKAPKNTMAARFVASCGRDVTTNEYRERLKKRRDETVERMEKLKKMREEMQAQDEILAKLREEAEKAQAEVSSSPPKHSGTNACRCKLVGRARCATCGRSVGGTFYHCCLCTGRTYLHCRKCGNRCQNKSHADMKKMETYCIVM